MPEQNKMNSVAWYLLKGVNVKSQDHQVKVEETLFLNLDTRRDGWSLGMSLKLTTEAIRGSDIFPNGEACSYIPLNICRSMKIMAEGHHCRVVGLGSQTFTSQWGHHRAFAMLHKAWHVLCVQPASFPPYNLHCTSRYFSHRNLMS